jgi:uncharacterized membrane protein (UPF0127 family)
MSMRKIPLALALVFFALVLAGCLDSGQKGYGTAKVQLPDGKLIDCEVRDTDAGRESGLMGYDSLCESCGMLFVFDNDARYAFWMKNMKMNIDIIFIDKDWKVVGIAQDVPPCPKEPCAVYRPETNARYVLELKANATGEHKIFIDSGIKKIE